MNNGHTHTNTHTHTHTHTQAGRQTDKQADTHIKVSDTHVLCLFALNKRNQLTKAAAKTRYNEACNQIPLTQAMQT